LIAVIPDYLMLWFKPSLLSSGVHTKLKVRLSFWRKQPGLAPRVCV
jgi:hypothetical protein